MFQVEFVEKIKTYFMFSKIVLIFEIKWKNTAQPERQQMTIAHAHCVLGIYGYKHTLRILNTCCFSTPTMDARMRLNMT
jgi:hypothetical protein